MELGLKFEEITWFEETGAAAATQEEALETAIPEYCPDIARIVDAVGQVCLREKKLSDGQLTAGGAVKVKVLYTSEESAGLRALTLSVPFTCRMDDQRLAACKATCINTRLLLCEVKAVTSRKVYVRVMPELTVTGYLPQKCQLCTQADEDIQVRWEDWEAEMLSDIAEREFSYTQEVLMDSTHPTPDDLLTDRMNLHVTECRHIGSKLVVKGEALLSVLYRAEGQQLRTYEAALPFSQILDGMDQQEDAAFDVYPQLHESELRVMRTESGSGFGVTARIGLLVFVREKRKTHYIADLYSTAYQTRTERTALQPATDYRRECVRENLVQKLEFGHDAPFFYLLQTDCGQVTMGNEGNRTALRSNVRMKVLYLDESGSPMSTERTAEVSAAVAKAPNTCWPVCGQPSEHTSGGSGEVQMSVEFLLGNCEKKEISLITGAQMLENAETAPLPSVVMRRMEPGETLWDIAKQYRTDRELIRSVNELSDDEVPEKMLLIPRMR